MDGSGLRRLSGRGGGSYGHVVSWSPDGRRIAFSDNNSPSGNASVYVINADRTNEKQIASRRNSVVGTPSWSLDGQKIVFDSFEADSDIFVVNADGTGETRLTHDSSSFSPSWSPDGRRIVFVRYVAQNHADDLFTMNADGSSQQAITNTPTADELDPHWSPGGARILFTRKGGIHTITPDGRRQRSLTPNGQGHRHPRREPRWSPDGRNMVFAQYLDAWDVVVMSANGQDAMRLTHSTPPVQSRSPEWSR